MHIDKTTLHDLSFLQGPHTVFSLLNRCTSQAGTEVLKRMIQQPPATYERLREQQDAVRFWMRYADKWTDRISNGTLVMIQKFYETADAAHERPDTLNLLVSAFFQKWFNKNQYSFVRFSITHLVDFMKGCRDMVRLLEEKPPEMIRKLLEEIQADMELPLCRHLLDLEPDAPQKELLWISYRARREIKGVIQKMTGHYAFLDALQSLARATREHGWSLPEILPPEALRYEAQQLFHPLLRTPVAYDIRFSREQRFLFLTGANMSGKSTLIRALGTSALLAHLGMGVPAAAMQISFLEGLITNMQAEDNLFLGESYFFAEVQRMKTTAQKLNKSRFHLVLMDELFKGTNVHDAYECSRAVIEGLLAQEENLMALSTHLNELAGQLQERKSSVFFRHFYTRITEDGNYTFTYQLKEGVSKDRIGYLVLKQEGVLDLLHNRQ